MRNSSDPELAGPDWVDRLCNMTQAASSYFERGDFEEAARRYEEILREFPGDPVAKSMLAMCAMTASV
jgi:hypothetical protein